VSAVSVTSSAGSRAAGGTTTSVAVVAAAGCVAVGRSGVGVSVEVSSVAEVVGRLAFVSGICTGAPTEISSDPTFCTAGSFASVSACPATRRKKEKITPTENALPKIVTRHDAAKRDRKRQFKKERCVTGGF
jgi:hypothetical protein